MKHFEKENQNIDNLFIFWIQLSKDFFDKN